MRKIIFWLILLICCRIDKALTNDLKTILKISLLSIGGYLAWSRPKDIALLLAAVAITAKKIVR